MKKVISLIGSRAGYNSYTKELCVNFIKELNQVYKGDLISEVLTADTWGINPCISCKICFHKGYCPQDKKDNLNVIKEKILAADIVILASPVYACNVSGDMKTLIDRLSLWLHTMPLIGKIGIPLCTTSNNNLDRVMDYLNEMLQYMGAWVPTDIGASRHKGTIELNDEENLHKYLIEKAELVYYLSKSNQKYTEKQEQYFIIQNKRYAKQIAFSKLYPSLSEDFAEARIWQEMGRDTCQTIYDVVKN